MRASFLIFGIAGLTIFAAACKRQNNQIQTYRIITDAPPPAQIPATNFSDAQLPPEHPDISGMNTSAPAKNQNPTGNSIWTIPPDWESLPPSEFLLAQFSISGVNSAKAEVNVAELAGEGGGLLANVNRWRGQLGLPQISETDLQSLTTLADSSNDKISIADFSGTDSKTGKPAQLIGAVVPQNGQTWFYKLMGDPQLVAQQKDAFLKFIQSAKYPDAR